MASFPVCYCDNVCKGKPAGPSEQRAWKRNADHGFQDHLKGFQFRTKIELQGKANRESEWADRPKKDHYESTQRIESKIEFGILL